MSKPVKLSDYVMGFLVDRGIKDVFTLVGGGAMHLNDSLGYCPGLNYICNLHEQACAVAAEAYAKYDNRVGAVLVTVGPGATNTLTGLAGAWLDSTPMIFLSGQVKRADMMQGSGVRNKGVQELDIVTIVGSITKYAATVMDPASVRYHLEKAFHLATTGRPGPVWIEIPLDVQAAMIDPDVLEGFTPEVVTGAVRDPVLIRKVEQTAELLKKAERPFLLFGNGVRLASALPELKELEKLLDMPFGLTWPAMDYFPETHPNLIGRPGPMAPRGANFALQNADVLLTIGARMDLVCTAFAPERLARGAKKVMVDIDQAELDKMGTCLELGICADAKLFIGELLRQLKPFRRGAIANWKNRCEAWKLRYPLTAPDSGAHSGLISMYGFTETLCRILPADSLVVPASSGNAVETLLLVYKVKAGQRVFITTGLGSMGFGLPASIGACLAHGRRMTVSLEGDGGLQMNSQELETLARLKLPVKMFIVNNGGYGSIISSQSAYFHRLTGCTPQSGLTFPDTLKLAAAYQVPAVRLSDPKTLEADLQSIFEAPGPCICEIMAIPDEPRQPRVSSFQKPDGNMASRPLEDMYPFLSREEFRSNMIVPPIEE